SWAAKLAQSLTNLLPFFWGFLRSLRSFAANEVPGFQARGDQSELCLSRVYHCGRKGRGYGFWRALSGTAFIPFTPGRAAGALFARSLVARGVRLSEPA